MSDVVDLSAIQNLGATEETAVVDDPSADSQETVGHNPAWDSVLSHIPTELHKLVEPELKKWDSKFNEVLNKTSKYKPFIENNIPPETIDSALRLRDALNSDPQTLIKQMAEHFGVSLAEAQEMVEEAAAEDESDISSNPAFKKLAEDQRAIAQVLLEREQEQQQRELSARVDSELEQIEKEYPDLDKVFVLQMAVNSGGTLLDTAKALSEFAETSARKTHIAAPKVMSASSGMPVPTERNVAKLSPQETRKLVADVLKANLQES